MKIKAKIAAQRYFVNNEPDYFVGRVTWYENGLRMWSESAGITRLNPDDAIDDCRKIVADRREANYFDARPFDVEVSL